jgi:hypothetical protein
VRLVLVLFVAATGLGLFAPTSAPASCAGPVIAVDGAAVTASTPAPPPDEGTVPVVRLARGASFTVTGQYFAAGCNDTGGCTSYGPGCTRCEQPEPPEPQRDVALTLTWNGRELPLGTSDADPATFVTTWSVTLPPDVVPGEGLAVLRAGYARPVAIEVER